jgi:hypothetical protein
MDNSQIEQLIAFAGESFYEHIQEQYGKNVEKILRFHDIDNYSILGEIDNKELLEIFEKPNDENSTCELIDLKKEICNTSQGNVSLKIGTKNKMIILLKSAHDLIKKRRRQLSTQAKLNRSDKYRSKSSSTNTSSSDSEINLKKFGKMIEEAIGKLLTNLKNNIHGDNYVNISANDFQVIIENINDQSVPSCFVQCLCGDRIKLFFNHSRFQLSNLIKHLKSTSNRSTLLMSNKRHEIDDQEVSDQMDVDEELSTNEINLSVTHSTLNKHANIDRENIDNIAPATIKKS